MPTQLKTAPLKPGRIKPGQLAPGEPAASALALAEALVAIVCHDLSSPLGTVINALQLAREDPSAATEALLLARQAATRTAQRLELLRAAWAGSSGALSRAGLVRLMAGLSPRVTTDLNGLSGRSFDGRTSQMLLHAMLVATTALPRGGTVVVAGGEDADLSVQPVGAHAAWPDRLVAGLGEPLPAFTDGPADALAPVLAILARTAGFQVSLVPPASGSGLACPTLKLARLT